MRTISAALAATAVIASGIFLIAIAAPRATAVPLDDVSFTSLDPARLLDTRSGATTIDGVFAGGGAPGQSSSVDLTVVGRGGVPASGVGAVVLNVTATEPTGSGFITAYPTGTQRPNASNLNFVAGQTTPNLVITKVGADGKVTLFNSAGSTHLIADVVGWFPREAVAQQITMQLDSADVDVVPGYSARTQIAVPNMIILSATAGGLPNVAFDLEPSNDRHSLNLMVAAGALAVPGDTTVTVMLRGCISVQIETCGLATDTAAAPLIVHIVGGGAGPAAELLAPDPARWVAANDYPDDLVLPDELTVIAKASADIPDLLTLLAELGTETVGVSWDIAAMKVRVDPANMTSVAAVLSQSNLVASVAQTRSTGTRLSSVPVDWSDDGTDQTWPFYQNGAVGAWRITTGSDNVEVGVVDNGILQGHPDLLPNLASYRSVVPRERDALASYVKGTWTVVYHGTHVAGTICAASNNLGLVGVAWNCKLRALDFGPTIGATSMVDIASAVNSWLNSYPGIRVVNMSFGEGSTNTRSCGQVPPQVATDAFSRLFSNHLDVLFVVSAGNCGMDVRNVAPANLANSFDNVISVGSVVEGGALDSISNTGAEVLAPGGYPIWSDTYSCPSGRTDLCAPAYGPKQGTSMAAPHITGTVVLMLAVRPELSPYQVAQCLKSNQTDLQPGVPSIHIFNAVICARDFPTATLHASPNPPHGYQTIGIVTPPTPGEYTISAFQPWGWLHNRSDFWLVSSTLAPGQFGPTGARSYLVDPISLRARSATWNGQTICAISSNGRFVVTWRDNIGCHTLGDRATGRSAYTEGGKLSGDGTKIVTDTGSVVVVHKAATGAALHTIHPPPGSWYQVMSVSEDGLRLGVERTLTTGLFVANGWIDVLSGAYHELSSAESYVTYDDGATRALIQNHSAYTVLDLKTNQPLRSGSLEPCLFPGVSMSPNGGAIFLGGCAQSSVIDVTSGTELAAFAFSGFSHWVSGSILAIDHGPNVDVVVVTGP